MGVISGGEISEARRKLGLNDATANDPLASYCTSVLRMLCSQLEDALQEEDVDPEVARRIIHRVVWGGMPHAVDATVRMDMLAERITRSSSGDPVPFRASPTESTH